MRRLFKGEVNRFQNVGEFQIILLLSLKDMSSIAERTIWANSK